MSLNQRWRSHRSHYRPAGEVIITSEYEVAPCARDDARAFVVEHHYSGSFPAARRCFGLYRRGSLAGVAVYSQPMHDAVLTRAFGGAARESLELGRFVLLDEVPGNGETWFLARCFAALRSEGFRGVLAYSDPVPRVGADGRVVFRGHVGTIYRAHNGVYTGRGRAQVLRVLPDGTVFSARAASKVRNREQGREYSARLLEAAGAEPLGGQDPAEWLRRWLPRVTTPLRHPGNLRYAWPLQPRVSVLLPRLDWREVSPTS